MAGPKVIPRLIISRRRPKTRVRSAGGQARARAVELAGRKASLTKASARIARAICQGRASVPSAISPMPPPSRLATWTRSGSMRSHSQPPVRLPATEPTP